MKNVILISLFVLVASCTDVPQSSNQQLAEKQEQVMSEAVREVGMPAISNYQERKLMKTILELRDQENLICYAYIVPEMTGKPVFLGKCLGYGLPYATQYTNPDALQRVSVSGGGWTRMVLPQADPNGLFMPESADGTWLMLLDEKGDPRVSYIEPKVMVTAFKLPNAIYE